MLMETGLCTATVDSRLVSLRLDETEAIAVHDLAASAAQEYGSVDNPVFLGEVTVIAHELPRAVRLAVERARLNDTGHAIVVSGNHIDWARLEPTPAHWREADTPGSRMAAFMAMIYSALLGAAIGWASQQQGKLVTDVVPTPGQEYSLVSSSSRAMLGWHTEDAHFASRGDHIGLLCLRNPTLVPTTMSYLRPERLDAKTLAVLQEPRFRIDPDPSHDCLGGQAPSASLFPLVTGPLEAPVLRIDRDFTSARPGDAQAARALAALIAHLDGNLYGLTLLPGDICFVDNRNVVHGREPFIPRYDGADRWLKRVNVVTDLRRTRPDRTSCSTRIIR
jgi:hypothetical protein